MRRSYCALLFLLPILASCSGASNSGAVPQDTLAYIPSSSLANRATESNVAALSPSPSKSANRLYVANIGSNSITVYRQNDSGNTAPLYVIAGPRTGIRSPEQLSQDAQGNLYVANGSTTSPGVLVFAHGAKGNVPPIRILAGPATGIHIVGGMTVDQITGKLFVSDAFQTNQGPTFSLARFPPNALGNQAPFARGATSFFSHELASDSTGMNLLDAHDQDCCNAFTAGVYTLVKQFANGTPPTIVYTTNMFDGGVVADPTTKTYLVTDGENGIYRLLENTVGAGPYMGYPATFNPPAVSVITSDTCGGQLAVAPGPNPETFVTHDAGPCSVDAIYVYAHDASGDARPARILGGSLTKLNLPGGIYLGK